MRKAADDNHVSVSSVWRSCKEQKTSFAGLDFRDYGRSEMTAGSKRQEQLEQVTFFVEGIPVPQGSKNVSRWGNVYDANHKQLKAWRAEIAQAAHGRHRSWPRKPCVTVRVEFILPRPKSVKRIYPAVKPDLDKPS